jgi:CheY-like chemotaxis protein
MATKGEETALGTARGRFIESLPRKAIELRGAIALLTATPAAEGPREDMRRRLHTLYASSLVFRNDALASAVKGGIDRLDAAREEGRPLSGDDLEQLTRLVKRIPELKGEEGSEARPAEPAPSPSLRPAPVPSAQSAPVPVPAAPAQPAPFPFSAPAREKRTLTGMAPVQAPPPATPASVRPPEPVREPPVEGARERDDREPAVRFATERDRARATTEREPTARFGTEVRSRTGLRPDSSRVPVLSRVLNVLVLAPPPLDTDVGAALATSSLTISVVHTVRAALDAAHTHAPDVIAADAALAIGGVLIGGLRGDPLTDFVPVVLLESLNQKLDVEEMRALGADDVLTRPFNAARLVRALGRVTGTLVEGASQLSLPAEASLEELAQHVSEEIRRGLVEAAETGRDQRVPLGEGAEVLAAAWAAVARMRAFVSQQTAGKVRFSDRALRGGASMLVLGKVPPDFEEGDEKPLRGRRILVVDDDTAVVWFFAGVLREEGATVLEATDGRDALIKAQTERPDVVISDILMPVLDGFALCRELKRDPALADVPVILISWKEDLLLRMRELSAGASGYLRKEVGAPQIALAVREVLKPRIELEAQLRASGEVRGNLEGTGVVPLLRSVRRARPDAKVTLRDAFNHFECELRDGRLAQLTRTASDGTFTRGERALPQLLGVNAGRFAVYDAEGPIKHTFEGSLDDVLTRGARELGALLEALSPHNADRVARVVLDEDAYASALKRATEGVRRIVERLHAGDSPAQLLARDAAPATLLEPLLMELARRGAIRGVVGTAGEDLVADARSRRAKDAPTSLHTPQSIIPTAPTPVISVLRPESSEGEGGLPSVLDPAAASERRSELRPLSVAPQQVAVQGHADTAGQVSARASSRPASNGEAAPASVPPAAAPPRELDTARRAERSPAEPASKRLSEPPAAASEGLVDDDMIPTGQFEPLDKDSIPTGQFDPIDKAVAEGPLVKAEPVPSELEGEPTEERNTEPDTENALVVADARSSAQTREVRDSISSEPDFIASDERRSKSTMAGWALALLVLIAIGFALGRREPEQASPSVEAIGKRSPSEQAPTPPSAAESPAPFGEPEAKPSQAIPPGARPLAQGDAVVVPRDAGFEIFDGILDKSAQVKPEQALLVVESGPGLEKAELLVDGNKAGTLPAKVALAEGVHELAIVSGDAVSYRFASVHRGKTWVLHAR